MDIPLYNKVFGWIAKSFAHLYFRVYPFRFIGFQFDREPPKFYKTQLAKDLVDILMVGDVILTYDEGYVRNAFISEKATHCGIYLGKISGIPSVIHINPTGLRIDSLELFCYTDRVDVKRSAIPLISGDLAKLLWAAQMLYAKHPEYDFTFESDDTRFYCAELVVKLYEYMGVNAKQFFVTSRNWGKDIYYPDRFLSSCVFSSVYLFEKK